MTVRDDFTRGEAIGGLVWLSIGALLSLLLEVVYLSTWLPLPGGTTIPFPITIAVAFWFNGVLTKTARLWDRRQAIALIPGLVWVVGYFGLLFGVEFTGDQLMASDIKAVGLLLAGIAGAVWPILRVK
ncbi:hypothetical protein H0194_09720 [Corynebacterium incognita]|uniref:Uncharacterized protein n=1 Tax=Corynebacterium incognita TaxID=2754725 RepID=A0A7G7CNZ1_9CORY|nr:hypothetical protein [Corynebacterium incognita]QNE89307.1 hypothetical protein H0194_09720 [Corynebacterium incognita]